jgi:hypothetical protein
MQYPGGMLYERWQNADDSTMRSDSYKIKGKDTLWLETVELKRRGETIQYVSTVVGENKGQLVVFCLSRIENGKYTFENAAHDFPQRIVYELPRAGPLHACVEG